MLFNPEFRRHLWLDFSVHRLILTPLIVGLVVYLAHSLFSDHWAASTAYGIAWFFIFLWGTRLASEAVIEEVNQGTWDFQRQSTISPWSMAWGKLIGSTSFSWYGACISLFLYIVLRISGMNSAFSGEIPLHTEIFILVLSGLFTQGLAIIFSLPVLPTLRQGHSNRTFHFFLVAALLGISFCSYCLSAVQTPQLLSWYQYEIAKPPFALTSLGLFVGWMLIGLYRGFGRELQYQAIPWVWAIFTIFCMVYFSGFAPSNYEQYFSQIKVEGFPYVGGPREMAFLIGILLTYVAVFIDNINVVRYRKLLARMSENHILESIQQLPWWVISFVLTFLMGMGVVLFQDPTSQNVVFSASFIIICKCFLIRDILLIHYFNFSANPKKAFSTSVIYLFLLYLLIPLLLKALQLSHWIPALVPSKENVPLAICSGVVQMAIMGVLVYLRWEKRWKA